MLVTGEDGTGKSTLVEAIHFASPRARGPFVVFDALSGEDVDGAFASARGGTIVLEEISDLATTVQARLVRAIDKREQYDVRVLATTHRDLAADGSFRADLLHRVAVVTFALPPLRERRDDVPALAVELLRTHAAKQRKNVRTIAPDAMRLLAAHAWSGNVRELSNVIERAVVLASSDAIGEADLPAALRSVAVGIERESVTTEVPFDFDEATTAFQKKHVARVLAACGGRRERAAKLLNLPPATFYRHMKRLDLKGIQ